MGAMRTTSAAVLLVLCYCTASLVRTAMAQVIYDYQDIYETQWSGDHIRIVNKGAQVQLNLDTQSGAGFQSKANYTYGSFGINAKLVADYSAGVVAAFFVSSSGPGQDEIDFEFLGNVDGQNILQTNMFVDGVGGREQHIRLWFDPASDFHKYEIVWNHAQTFWMVDGVPIRVFRNLESITGQPYPKSKPAKVLGCIFDGSSWATRLPSGEALPVDYTYAPFVVTYGSFGMDGCENDGVTVPACSTEYQDNWWEGPTYTTLSDDQIQNLKEVTLAYSTYNYCKDSDRYNPQPAECIYNYND